MSARPTDADQQDALTGQDEALDAARTARAAPFNPAAHLIPLSGRGGKGPSQYLEVKWRMVWLRAEHPDAAIDTTLIEYSDHHAIFKATVSIPGGGSATGWGSEAPADFRDFIEKAETKALGRALAALGYGTQFCEDYGTGIGEATGTMRLVDTPVDFTRPNASAAATPKRPPQSQAQGGGPQYDDEPREERRIAPGNEHAPATEAQLKFAATLIRESGVEAQTVGDPPEDRLQVIAREAALLDGVAGVGEVDYRTFTRAQISRLINELQRIRRNG